MATVRRLTKFGGLVLLACLLLCGCDLLTRYFPAGKLPGMVQGQCLDKAGHSYGMVSVVLKETATGTESTVPAESSGSFLFQTVKPGHYSILTFGVGGAAIPNDLSSTVGSEAWNSRDLKSRPH